MVLLQSTQHKWLESNPNTTVGPTYRQRAKVFVEYSITRKTKGKALSARKRSPRQNGQQGGREKRRKNDGQRNGRRDGRDGNAGRTAHEGTENETDGRLVHNAA